jgi:uncharacterized protein
MGNSNSKRNNSFMQAIMDFVGEEQQKALEVSVMGQTGVGKSSLVNALFGTDLPTDPVRPGTTEIQPHVVYGKNGHKVTFYDLPGVGETAHNGKEWIPKYREYVSRSDVVIWAILAESRAFMQDQETLEDIMKGTGTHEEKRELLSKIVFVLTKTDHLTDFKVPVHWFSVKAPNNPDERIHVPDAPFTELIKRKERYFQETFMEHFKSFMQAQTYYKGRFKVDIPGMTYGEGIVHYEHFVEEEKYREWSNRYPEYKSVFRRLYECCRVIPCSARFRYNLDPVMNAIIDKLDTRSAGRFGGFVEQEPMDRIPYLQAMRLINIISLDTYAGLQQLEGQHER